jgi:uncharacterized membrane protein
MPEEINGLPLHALVVHATVVLTPLAAVAAIVFALVPRWRYILRWPTAVTAVAAFLTVYAAKVSGPKLEKARFANVSGVLADRLRIHQNRANTLFLISIGFVIVAVAATWLIGASRSKLPTAAQWAVALVLVGFSVATLIYVALTGEAGARAVWGQ